MPPLPSIPARVWCDQRAQLGEGPVWWEDTLYWVDIEGHAVFARSPGRAEPRAYPVGERVGALVPWPGHGLLVALQGGLARLELATGALTPLFDPEPTLPENRLNDGKCDPAGRLVIGSMDCAAAPGAGNVHCIAPGFACTTVRRGVTISNGLAWSADGRTLYYIDTPTGCVEAITYDLATGAWGASRTVITIPPESGFPDGMCIDDAGHLWIALWDGWGVECWDPTSGQRLARIDLPVARVTCPTFGGEDRATLFITTAQVGLDASQQAAQPGAGKVFTARPGVTGPGAVPFGGEG